MNDSTGTWNYIGTTPLDSVRIPNGYLEYKFEGEDFFNSRVMTNLNEFEVICVNKFNELTIIHLPDAEDLLVFFGSLVNGDKIYL